MKSHSNNPTSLFHNPFPFSVYRVGGAVRDALMGYPYSEVDWVVVGATPEALLNQGFQAVGKDFPVFLHPTTKEEYALARTERKSGKGYTGFTCYSSPDITLEDDLRRRDLTINAMAQSQNGDLIDPYGGLADLHNHVLRHVSDAFEEDPVRVLRLARFAARYHHLGFTIAPETQALLKRMVDSGEVSHLTSERVWKECERAHQEKSPAIFWQTLFECGALAQLSPLLQQRLLQMPSNFSQLTALFDQITTTSDRFSALLLWADSIQSLSANNVPNGYLSQLLPTLPIPKIIQTQSQHCLTLWRWLLSPPCPDSAPQLFAFFSQCGAFKNDEKWQFSLTLCQAFSKATPMDELSQGNALNVSTVSKIKHKWAVANLALEKAKTITPQQLMAQGFQGKALGEALEQERVKRIQTCLEEEQ